MFVLNLLQKGAFFMQKRGYVTYFGQKVPRFKEEKLGAGSVTIRFVLTGKTPSKKNNQMSVAVRKIARAWASKQQKSGKSPTWRDVNKAISLCQSKVRPNKEYQEWVVHMKPVIQKQAAWWVEQLKSRGLVFPLQKASVSFRLYFKDRYVSDTTNKVQSLQDLMVSAGIIANDDYKTLNPILSASACYYQELTTDIAFISLSFRLDKSATKLHIPDTDVLS